MPLFAPPSFRHLFLCLLLLAVSGRGTVSVQKDFTLADLYDGSFYGEIPDVRRWLKDGDHFLAYGGDGKGYVGLLRTNARTGKIEPFSDRRRMTEALVLAGIERSSAERLAEQPEINLNRDEDRILLSHRQDLYVYDRTADRAVRLTESPEPETDPTFSPDGKQVAFTRGHDLYSVNVATPRAERRLTRDGGNRVRNGRLDWVYEEEIYGRGRTRGFEWSPDSRRLAFLRIDDSPVTPVTITDHLRREPASETYDFPLPGEKNPVARLGIVPADASAPAIFAEEGAYPPENRLLVRFAWTPNGRRLTLQIQPRNGAFLDLNLIEADTGKSRTLLRETTPAWTEILDSPHFLPDGSFLWLSDRTGFRHLYRYRNDGTLIGPVTKGEWSIRKVHGTDNPGAFVWFDAGKQSSVGDHTYRTAVDGKGEPQRLTGLDGNHEVRFNADFSLFVDTVSDARTPPRMFLRGGNDGSEIRVVARNDTAVRAVARYRFSPPEMLKVRTRDGFSMDARIIRPPDFDPARRYPVWMEVYGGPGSPSVRDEWDWTMWRQLLAQKGYIVWMCDNRSASNRGARFVWTVHRRLGAGELADIEDSVTYLRSLPYVDASRIGISGWSYGGFLAAYALTHSASFKCGFAGAPVTDWRWYDSVYTERYMDLPSANPTGYRAACVAESAGNYAGRLMIVHGLMDDNVHVRHSLRLAYELQRAEKLFDMMLYPSPAARHDIADPAQSRHLKKLELDFIESRL
ncbi:MAG: DPP IV N-terminal domain-containing protein [Capsulimonadales bacterium]|nr:DPP IV N-terminal domain-containing protein [Capsulimonadales bacterium]